jgi:hypothetical protein
VFRQRGAGVINDGYNATVAADVNRRYGAGAFEAVFIEARQQSEETLAIAKQSWHERHRSS